MLRGWFGMAKSEGCTRKGLRRVEPPNPKKSTLIGKYVLKKMKQQRRTIK